MKRDFSVLPKEIQEHSFDFHWDNQKVWSLDIPVEEMEVAELEWMLHLPFWDTEEVRYVIPPMKVMKDPTTYPHHKDRIEKAEILHPIDLMKNQSDRWLILDGMHRLIHLMMKGEKKVKVRKISRDLIPLIER